jgi:hypothetical protein
MTATRKGMMLLSLCVLRFDNEAGKGDHFHRGEAEAPYLFTSLERLLADFWTAVDDWRK